jgi:signal transduction histidine kinase
VDVVVAAGVTAFLVAVTSHIPRGASERALDPAGYALLVAAGASVGIVRRWPRTTLGVVTAVLAAYVVRGYVGGPVFATAWIALYVLRRATDRRTALTGAALLGVTLLVAGLAGGHGLSPLPLVFAGWSAAAVFLGDAVTNRHRYLAQAEERARDLERTREEEARRLVAEDRLRIARDLHDSVAHAMATISVQAGAAEHVLDRRPDAAKEALAAIRRASGDVLDELGAMLTLLRDDGERADRAPTPGLDRVADLVATSRANGLAVTLALDGPLDAVPAAVGTAAYRIVQESLTNVLRHAPRATAAVTVRAGPGGALEVSVTDDGAGAGGATDGTGVGIRGMRERAAATGGSVTAGPAPGGGFAVRAVWERR